VNERITIKSPSKSLQDDATVLTCRLSSHMPFGRVVREDKNSKNPLQVYNNRYSWAASGQRYFRSCVICTVSHERR